MANNDPIFVSRWFHWSAKLQSEVFPRIGGAIGPSAPLLLGKVGDAGGVISSVNIQSTGNRSATVAALYTLKEGSTICEKRCEVLVPVVSGSTLTSVIPSVNFTLPDFEPFEGCIVELLKLEPRESLYCALLAFVLADAPIFVHAVGGVYDP